MHGPLEVLSRNAVRIWAGGSLHCVNHFQNLCNGDCFWGEDLFVDQCLWKVLNVRRENDFRLLAEDHCEPPSDWNKCDDSSFVAFHPFKTLEGYGDCLDNALKHEGDCHTATEGERCYSAVSWAMKNGVDRHPEWYEGLTSKSDFTAFQALFHKTHQHHCEVPCKPVKSS